MKMKKIVFYFSIFAAIALNSCNKENESDILPPDAPSILTGDYEIIANGNWEAEDQVYVWHGGSKGFVDDGKFTLSDPSTSTFKGTLAESLVSGTEYNWYVVSPSAEGSPASCTIPVSEKSQYGKIKAIAGENAPSVNMLSLVAFAKVNIKNTTNRAIIFNSASLSCGNPIFGKMCVDFTDEKVKYIDCPAASQSVLISETESRLPAGETMTFTIAVKPFTANEEVLKLELDNFELTNALNEISFEAGKTVDVNYEINAPDVPEIEEGTVLAASGTASPVADDLIQDWMAFQLTTGVYEYVYRGWLNQGTFFCFGKNNESIKYVFSATDNGAEFGEQGGESAMTITEALSEPSTYNKWTVTKEGYYEIVLDCYTSKLKATYLCDAASVFSKIEVEKLYLNVKYNDQEQFGIRADQMIEMEKTGNGVFKAKVSVPEDKISGQFRCQMDLGGHSLPVILPSDSDKSVAECDGGLAKTPFVLTMNGTTNFWLHTDTPGHSYVITVDLKQGLIWANCDQPSIEASDILLSGPAIGYDWGNFAHMKKTDNQFVFEFEVEISGKDEMFTIHLDGEQRSLIPFSGGNEVLSLGENKFKYRDAAADCGWFVPNIPAGKYKLTVNLQDYTLTVTKVN